MGALNTVTTTTARLFIGGSAVDCETESSIEMSAETQKIVCKDNPNGVLSVKEISITYSMSGLMKSAGYSGKQIAIAMNNKQEVVALFQDTEDSAFQFSSKAYITSFSCQSSGVGELVTFSATLTGFDTITIS